LPHILATVPAHPQAETRRWADLFQLSAPWWHFPLGVILIDVLGMVLVRMSGKGAVGPFTPLDLVLLILIGNAVQNGLNGGDNSLTGAAILAACLIALNYAVAFPAARSRAAETLVEGVPVVLARDGRVFREMLRRELVSRRDFEEALRSQGVGDLSEGESWRSSKPVDGSACCASPQRGRATPR
jgi:uncharacterized membrane protein YcaP (DUF421 family)